MTPTLHLVVPVRLRSRRSVALAAALVLGGCASMTGVGGSAEFGCKAPLGVKCDSVSGNYYNAVQQNLPSQQKGVPSAPQSNAAPALSDQLVGKESGSANPSNRASPKRATMSAVALEANAPLRSPPRVLRLWIKPWEDSDGDLHTQSYVYVPIDTGRWLIDHRASRPPDAYLPTKATRAVKRVTPAPAVAVDSAQTGASGGMPVISGSSAATPLQPGAAGEADDHGR